MRYALKTDCSFVMYFSPSVHHITSVNLLLLRDLLKSNVSLVFPSFKFYLSILYSHPTTLSSFAIRSLHIVSPSHSFQFLILDLSEQFWDFVKNEDNLSLEGVTLRPMTPRVGPLPSAVVDARKHTDPGLELAFEGYLCEDVELDMTWHRESMANGGGG